MRIQRNGCGTRCVRNRDGILAPHFFTIPRCGRVDILTYGLPEFSRETRFVSHCNSTIVPYAYSNHDPDSCARTYSDTQCFADQCWSSAVMFKSSRTVYRTWRSFLARYMHNNTSVYHLADLSFQASPKCRDTEGFRWHARVYSLAGHSSTCRGERNGISSLAALLCKCRGCFATTRRSSLAGRRGRVGP